MRKRTKTRMGKVTGFLEIDRRDRQVRAGVRSHPALPRVHDPARRGGDARPGGALHGLRHPVLPQRLPGEQPDPGLERPRLQRTTGTRRCATCTRPTTSRSSPAASARRPARRPARSTSRTRRSPSRRSNAPSSTAAGRRAGSSRSRPTTQTGKRVAVVGSGPAGLAARAAARARRPRGARLREERHGRRAAALRHPRLQDGEAPHRPPRRADGGGGRHLPLRRPCRRDDARPSELLDEYDAVRADRRRREAARPADPGPRPRRHPFRHGFPAAAEPPRLRRERRRRTTRSSPTASTSSSSAAATPAPTASAPRSARARCRSPSSRSCRSRRRRENKPLTWPNWPLKLRTSSQPRGGRRARLRRR